MSLFYRAIIAGALFAAGLVLAGCPGWCTFDSDCAAQERCDWDRRCVPQDYHWPGNLDGGIQPTAVSSSGGSSRSSSSELDAGTPDCGIPVTPTFSGDAVYAIIAPAPQIAVVFPCDEPTAFTGGLPQMYGDPYKVQVTPWDGNLVFLANGLLLRFRADARTYGWQGCTLSGDPVLNDEEIAVPQCAGSQNRVADFRVLPDEQGLIFSCQAHPDAYMDQDGGAVNVGWWLLSMGANRQALVREPSYTHTLFVVSRTGESVPVTGLPPENPEYTLMDTRSDGDGFRLALGFAVGKEQWRVNRDGTATRAGIYADTPRGIVTGDRIGKMDAQGRLYTRAMKSTDFAPVVVRYELAPGTAQVMLPPDGGSRDVTSFFSGP